MKRRDTRDAIDVGTAVFAAHGLQLEIVTEGNTGYSVIGKGPMPSRDYFVPISAVTKAENGRATLIASMAETLASGWDRGQAGGT